VFFRRGGDFHEEVEVIGHHAEGEDADLAELFVEPHVLHELFPFLIPQDEAPIHDPRDAMVDGRLALQCFQLFGAQFVRPSLAAFQRVDQISLVPGG
jgi:hypothetical protein